MVVDSNLFLTRDEIAKEIFKRSIWFDLKLRHVKEVLRIYNELMDEQYHRKMQEATWSGTTLVVPGWDDKPKKEVKKKKPKPKKVISKAPSSRKRSR